MPIRNGIDQLTTPAIAAKLKNKRLGVLCHAASVDRNMQHVVSILANTGCQIQRIFAPEHGLSGNEQAMDPVADRTQATLTDANRIVSLYGNNFNSLKPTPEHLQDIDLIVIDLQDIGARYYTYIWTAWLMIQAAAEAGCGVLLLDRLNPLGRQVEGPAIFDDYRSFVGLESIPNRHGLSYGELLGWLIKTHQILIDWEVVTVKNGSAKHYFDEQHSAETHNAETHSIGSAQWVLPSPNMPTLDTAIVYPGMCLLEGTNISEARGTTKPFELLGAPWIDSEKLASQAGSQIEGAQLRATGFKPTFEKHAGTDCHGVQVHVVDRDQFRPLFTTVVLIQTIYELWPKDFEWRTTEYEFVTKHPAIDLLAGGDWLRKGIESGLRANALSEHWSAYEQQFKNETSAFHLYD